MAYTPSPFKGRQRFATTTSAQRRGVGSRGQDLMQRFALGTALPSRPAPEQAAPAAPEPAASPGGIAPTTPQVPTSAISFSPAEKNSDNAAGGRAAYGRTPTAPSNELNAFMEDYGIKDLAQSLGLKTGLNVIGSISTMMDFPGYIGQTLGSAALGALSPYSLGFEMLNIAGPKVYAGVLGAIDSARTEEAASRDQARETMGMRPGYTSGVHSLNRATDAMNQVERGQSLTGRLGDLAAEYVGRPAANFAITNIANPVLSGLDHPTLATMDEQMTPTEQQAYKAGVNAILDDPTAMQPQTFNALTAHRTASFPAAPQASWGSLGGYDFSTMALSDTPEQPVGMAPAKAGWSQAVQNELGLTSQQMAQTNVGRALQAELGRVAPEYQGLFSNEIESALGLPAPTVAQQRDAFRSAHNKVSEKKGSDKAKAAEAAAKAAGGVVGRGTYGHIGGLPGFSPTPNKGYGPVPPNYGATMAEQKAAEDAAYAATGSYRGPSNVGGSISASYGANDPNASGKGGGGKGGGGGKVLCTELNRQGLLPDDIYTADSAYGLTMDPRVVVGYHLWAKPLVKLMRRSRLVTAMVKPFVHAWAYHMAWKMGVVDKPNRLGAVLESVGVPVCKWIGERTKRRLCHG